MLAKSEPLNLIRFKFQFVSPKIKDYSLSSAIALPSLTHTHSTLYRMDPLHYLSLLKRVTVE